MKRLPALLRLLSGALAAALLLFSGLTWRSRSITAAEKPATASVAAEIADGALFTAFVPVLRHPRCMNCHTFTDFPRQGDDRHRHVQMVVRGPNNTGFPTLQCSACHQTTNVADGAVPGAPNWHLAPLRSRTRIRGAEKAMRNR